jgi:hypothetical protein
MGNRPNVSNNKFFNEIASSDDCTDKVKHAFTIPDTHCSLIIGGCANSSQSFNRCRKRIGQSVVVKNTRHVYLHIKPVRTPIFCEVGLAAGCDLDSRESLPCVLPAGVESATGVVSLIILTIIELDDIRHDDKLEETGENISAEVTPESFHDPKKLGNLQE